MAPAVGANLYVSSTESPPFAARFELEPLGELSVLEFDEMDERDAFLSRFGAKNSALGICGSMEIVDSCGIFPDDIEYFKRFSVDDALAAASNFCEIFPVELECLMILSNDGIFGIDSTAAVFA